MAELEAAERLIVSTRAAVGARLPDQASLIAAGHVSIGEGRVTPDDHSIKPEYLTGGRELDPERVESVGLALLEDEQGRSHPPPFRRPLQRSPAT